MAFTGMKHLHAARTEQGEQALHGGDSRLKSRHIVAEAFAEAAALDEVALHVDDDQRRVRGPEMERRGLGIDVKRSQCPCPAM